MNSYNLLNEVEIRFDTYKNEKNIILKTGLITQGPFPDYYDKFANQGNNRDLMLPSEEQNDISNMAEFHELCPIHWTKEELLGFSAIRDKLGKDGYKELGVSWLEGGNAERERLFGNQENNMRWKLDELKKEGNSDFKEVPAKAALIEAHHPMLPPSPELKTPIVGSPLALPSALDGGGPFFLLQ